MLLFHIPLFFWIAGGIAAALLFALVFGTAVIGAQESGLVTKKYGRALPPGRIIARAAKPATKPRCCRRAGTSRCGAGSTASSRCR